MISNITNTFIKAKKAFTNENFNESQNLLNKVLKHDKDFLSAYLLSVSYTHLTLPTKA